ncbi:MAG: hypothetical protein S4CHLAM7_06130 [Chlamydiae bacterium]|nr:hypothetical protein [Chlamydiota bacterium]
MLNSILRRDVIIPAAAATIAVGTAIAYSNNIINEINAGQVKNILDLPQHTELNLSQWVPVCPNEFENTADIISNSCYWIYRSVQIFKTSNPCIKTVHLEEHKHKTYSTSLTNSLFLWMKSSTSSSYTKIIWHTCYKYVNGPLIYTLKEWLGLLTPDSNLVSFVRTYTSNATSPSS